MSADFDRAHVLLGQGRPDLAEAELRQGLAQDPNNAPGHALLALCLLERGDFQAATEEAAAAVGLAPDEPFVHYARARVLQERNQLDEALAAIREAVWLDPEDADFQGQLAAIRYDQREWQAALDAAEVGLGLDAEHVGCNNLRAMALVKLGRKQEAARTLGATLSRAPENAVTHANMGWALLEQREPSKALEHFREALRLDPRLESAREGTVEALKARYLLYRLLLYYFLWMAKLSGKAQWGVILGLYVGYRVLREVAERSPELAPYLQPALVAYLGFVLSTWLGKSLSNLLLRWNRFGRMLLSREEIVASNWVGLCLLGAATALGAWAITQEQDALFGAAVFGLLAIPIAGTFSCQKGWPRNLMAAYTGALALLGIGGFFLYLLRLCSDGDPLRPLLLVAGGGMMILFFIGIFVSQWVANGLVMVRPTK